MAAVQSQKSLHERDKKEISTCCLPTAARFPSCELNLTTEHNDELNRFGRRHRRLPQAKTGSSSVGAMTAPRSGRSI
jgi:hypothetical protein